MKNNVSVGILIICSLFISSCVHIDVFEKNIPVPKHSWSNHFKPAVEFSIKDTNALYTIYFVIRHTDAYQYNNIWVHIYTSFPGDTALQKQRFNIPLGNDAKGWLGSGMDDIFEHRFAITMNQPVKFPKPGNYKFIIENIMRDDPLPEVMNVGIRIEKAK